jgi:hypothetical protein
MYTLEEKREFLHFHIAEIHVLWAKIRVGDPDPDLVRSESIGKIRILERTVAVRGTIFSASDNIRF